MEIINWRRWGSRIATRKGREKEGRRGRDGVWERIGGEEMSAGAAELGTCGR